MTMILYHPVTSSQIMKQELALIHESLKHGGLFQETLAFRSYRVRGGVWQEPESAGDCSCFACTESLVISLGGLDCVQRSLPFCIMAFTSWIIKILSY